MPVPESIDHDAGRERMFGLRQPLRKLQAATLTGINWALLDTDENARQTARRGPPKRQVVSAQMDAQVGRLAIAHGHHFRQGWGRFLFEFYELLPHVAQFLLHVRPRLV